MQIKINNKIYETSEGETILDVCRREKIRIPTLCAHGKLKREAICRLCLVEINLTDKLVPSCAFPVCEKLEVTTESEKIQKAREINLELLWSDHAGKCAACKKNLCCGLQNLAEDYKIENFHFVPRHGEMTDTEERDLLRDNWSRVVVDDKNPVIHRTTEFCVECRRCINICPVKSYGFNNRGGDVVVGTPYNQTLDCIFCGACVKHCPTAALTDQNNWGEIEGKLDDLETLAVAILDPAIMKSIGNEMEFVDSEEKLGGALKHLGFEKVFSLNRGLQKYVEEISKELEGKKNNQVIFNSHCPAFNLYIKKYYPELEKNLAKTEIPDEILAEAIKTQYAKSEKINPKNIVVISISSCTAKKFEKYKYLDYVLTVRELGRLSRKRGQNGENVAQIREQNLDKFTDDGINKEAEIYKSGKLSEIAGSQSKTAKMKKISLNSMAEIRETLDEIKKRKASYDFVEAMICPGGCEKGGGTSINF